MSVDQTKLNKQLLDKAQNKDVAVDPGVKVAQYFKGLESKIAEVLPKHVSAQTLTRIAITEIRTNPKLLDCSLVSLAGAVMKSAQLGLQLGLLGHCYLVPYGTEATFILGYKGMIVLARRSGEIKEIYAVAVYENDEFNCEYGLHRSIKHIPKYEDRGAFKGAYMVAHFMNGGYHFEYLPAIEIDKRRKRSKAANNGPWVTDFEEMAKKTVVRFAFDYLPVSTEILTAVHQDETTTKEIRDDGEIVDLPIDYSNKHEGAIDSATGEIIEKKNDLEDMEKGFVG